MIQKKYIIFVGLISLFVISLYINYGQYNQPEKLSSNDFSISNFKYKSDFPNSDPLWISLPDKTLIAQASLVITANKGNTYFEVYDAYNNSLVLGSLFAANPGDNEVRISGIKLSSLNQQPQILICGVANSAFLGKWLSENPNAICKTETFPSPKVDAEITPNVMEFTVSKKDYNLRYNLMTVKNTGDVMQTFYLGFLQNGNSLIGYETSDIRNGVFQLAPGQSHTISIGASTGGGTNWNTPTATYDSIGHIYALNTGDINNGELINGALFKKEFILRTTLTE